MQSFSSRVIIICSYKEPQSQKTQMASHHWPKTTSPENPNPNNPIQDPRPNRNPQTTINAQKWERNTKNSSWKNISSWICSIREYNIGWYIIIFSSNAINSDIRYWSIIKNVFHVYLLKSNNWEKKIIYCVFVPYEDERNKRLIQNIKMWLLWKIIFLL